MKLQRQAFSSMKKISLPSLKYDYGDLSPVFSARAIELHHKIHHQNYVDKFNLAVDEFAIHFAKGDNEKAHKALSVQEFAYGGYANHILFFDALAPVKAAGPPNKGALLTAITQSFGGLEAFIKQFNVQAAEIKGSGWCWLARNPGTQALSIAITQNQSTLGPMGLQPLLGIDMWEHTFYPNYEADKHKFLNEVWKVVDWKVVEKRLANSSA